jgi:micrococcal nuclease
LRKNRLFILILFLFFALALSYPPHAREIFPPIPHNESEISKCNFQRVSRVIDGDTFELLDGTRIRLLGVDTPEVVDPRKDVQWFGREASKKLKEWIEGKTICLRQDKDKTQNVDKYARLLRYVWSESTRDSYQTRTEKSTTGEQTFTFFVNAELIKQGYGFAYTRYPFEYLEDFRRYEREARENNRGLWDEKKYEIWRREVEKNRIIAKTCDRAGTICPENAINHIGKKKTVRFFIEKSHDSGKAVFFNSKNNYTDPDNFTVVIFKEDKDKFPDEPADFYWGKTVDVTGIIKEYKGRAEIILKDNSQIKIVR